MDTQKENDVFTMEKSSVSEKPLVSEKSLVSEKEITKQMIQISELIPPRTPSPIPITSYKVADKEVFTPKKLPEPEKQQGPEKQRVLPLNIQNMTNTSSFDLLSSSSSSSSKNKKKEETVLSPRNK